MNHDSPVGSVSTMSHARRLWACIAFGVVGGLGVAVTDLGWEFAVLIGWSLTATVFLSWVWFAIARLDANQTAHRATIEDDTRAEAGFALLAASMVSLIGIAFGLHHASTLKGTSKFVMTTLCVLAIALAWTVVHTVFTLRYAHEYYGGQHGSGHGIDFGPEKPSFSDFAYFAFTIGMTYQVSDTNITSRAIRRTATRQALLSFVFGTTIVAVTINVVAGFVN